MNRRTFLAWGLSASTLAVLSACNKVFGSPEPSTTHGAGHNMGAMTPMTANTDLLPVTALPAGLPLAALPLLKNESTEANTFKAYLTAKETSIELVAGKPTRFWTYNDQIPGPQIAVYEGDTIQIHFKNQLSQPTTIHWHGLPVTPEQDGNPHDPVLPGQTHTYQFTLPIGSAGTYWYHTHAHELAAEQAFRGLAGSLIVRAKDDPLTQRPEQHWFFSDLRLDNNAQIPENNMMDWMNGREGQFVLINGQRQPQMSIKGNERIRIWNACSARYLNLAIPNCELIVVGTDGGLLEKPAPAVSSLLIAPAERYEIIVRAQKSGTYPLNNLPYDRQKMMVAYQAETSILANISIQANEIALPTQLRSIPDLGAPVARKRVSFSEKPMSAMMSSMGGNMQGMNHGTMHGSGGASMNHAQKMMNGMFLVNDQVFDMKRMDLTSQVGAVEEWTITNNSHMDHPFHLHGTQFILLDRTLNGKTETAVYKSFKDTVNLRPNEQIRIKTVQHHKGIRMFHCHILEHESLGMMAQLNVI